MVNERAIRVDTGVRDGSSAMLKELSPLFDLTDALIALAVACAVLAILAVVLRGLLATDEERGASMFETLSGVARILAIVAIVASMAGFASWVLDQMDAPSFVEQALRKAR